MPDLPALSDLEQRDLEHNTATLRIKTLDILTLQWFWGSIRHRLITPSPWSTTHLPGLNAHGQWEYNGKHYTIRNDQFNDF